MAAAQAALEARERLSKAAVRDKRCVLHYIGDLELFSNGCGAQIWPGEAMLCTASWRRRRRRWRSASASATTRCGTSGACGDRALCSKGCGALIWPGEAMLCCRGGKHILGEDLNPPMHPDCVGVLELDGFSGREKHPGGAPLL